MDTSVHSTEAPTEAAAETLNPYELPLLLWIKTKNQIFRSGLVRETGCGCPVDTSVRSTEAPTEAAAETLNPYELPYMIIKCFENTCTMRIKKELSNLLAAESWCERRDLNPYELPHTPLKRARLPIPPLSHINFPLSQALV